MGVLSDLSGQPAEPLAPIAERKFLEIDIDNFDERLRSMKPRVAMQVENTLTGEGRIGVDMTFESMDDFSPAAIARKVEPLAKLLEARSQLRNLLTYMDGKSDAEQLVAKIDEKLSSQVNVILHSDEFQKVESAWRGLHYLVTNTESDETLKLRVLNISKGELHRSLRKYKGVAWDQSPLFKKLYEEEY